MNNKGRNPVIQFKNVSKIYTMGEVEIKAVDDVSFEIYDGEFVVILGASGAGKTTILNLLGGMDNVTHGNIYVDNTDITKFNERRLTKFRREDIGFVFQFYNLINNLNALDNVEFAADVCEDHLNAKEILERVNLTDRMRNFPSQLSGGEQQRVAIARAVTKNPKLLLCDEPTGALDYETGKKVLKLLSDINREYKKTTIIITHNSALAALGDKVISIRSGRVESIEINKTKKAIEEIEW